MALTGMQHVSRTQFANKFATAYHNSVMRHFDAMTAGGVVINTAPNVPMLSQGFLSICEQNMSQHNQINWIGQIGKYVKLYWTGGIITGPTGIVNITSPGGWMAPPVVQNYDFNIILWTFEATARVHIMSLIGIYTSTVVPGVVTPWSGATLQTIP